MANKCFWNPDTLEVAYEVRPSDSYSQEGTTEEYQALVASRPIPPAPDWLSFNLAMIPPTTESTFEVWLGQFKEPYRAALAVASSEGNTERVQGQYEILKDLAPPTAEQITEWQSIADRHNIRLTF